MFFFCCCLYLHIQKYIIACEYCIFIDSCDYFLFSTARPYRIPFDKYQQYNISVLVIVLSVCLCASVLITKLTPNFQSTIFNNVARMGKNKIMYYAWQSVIQ